MRLAKIMPLIALGLVLFVLAVHHRVDRWRRSRREPPERPAREPLPERECLLSRTGVTCGLAPDDQGDDGPMTRSDDEILDIIREAHSDPIDVGFSPMMPGFCNAETRPGKRQL